MRRAPLLASGTVAHAAFAAQLAAIELVAGGGRRFLDQPRDLIGVAASVTAGLALAAWARRRPVRAALACATAAVVIAALEPLHALGAPLDVQMVSVLRHDPSRLQALAPHALGLTIAWLSLSLLEGLLLARAAAPPPGRATAAALVLLALTPSWRRATPELRMIHGLSALATPPDRRAPLAPLHPTRAPVPSVLLLITHATRLEGACAGPCGAIPEPNAPSSTRVALRAHRATSPVAALALRAMLTGRAAHPTRAEDEPATDLFTLAAHLRPRRRVVLLTARGLDEWGSLAPRATAAEGASVESLAGEVALGADTRDAPPELVADRCERAFALDPAPTLAVVRFGDAQARDGATADHETLAYAARLARDARGVARCREAFARAHEVAPYLIVTTSDHGAELDPARQSDASLDDGLLRVAATVESGNDGLGRGELEALRSHATEPTTHLDWFATIVDAWGLAPAARLEPRLEAPSTRSLIAESGSPRTVVVSRCAVGEPCAMHVWGLLEGSAVLWARPWDSTWTCEDRSAGVVGLDLASPRCRALAATAVDRLGRMPSGATAPRPLGPLPPAP